MSAQPQTAGWYPNPEDPSQQRYWDGLTWTPQPTMSAAGVFGRTFTYVVVLGFVAGIVSGTVGLPIIGTIIGAAFGLGIGIAVALITATVIGFAARASVTPRTYQRWVDVMLAILAVATVALAVVWMNQRALVGSSPAITMLIIVLPSLVVIRILLRRLGRARAVST
jgi:hypothetical protein